MRKSLLMMLLLIFLAIPVHASFLSEVKIYTREELKKLNDEALVQAYTDVIVERKANETFHGKAGFTPKEYQNYKGLLEEIIYIRQEMKSRELEPPPLEDWLR